MSASKDNFEDSLIHAVKAYRVLYNCNLKNSNKNTLAKQKAWNKIGTLLNRSPHECKSKWKHIRDSYRKNMKKVQTGMPAPKSKFNDEKLSFLEFTLQERNSFTSIPMQTEIEVKYIPEHVANEILEDDLALASICEKSQNEKHHPVASNDQLMDEILCLKKQRDDMMKIIVEARHHTHNPDSDTVTHHFFRSMADIVATLPAHRIVDIRLKICSLVSEMELLTLAEKSEKFETAST